MQAARRRVVAIAAGVIIAAIVIAVGVYLAMMRPAPITYIDVGVLVDLTGPLTSFGVQIRDALYIGVDDINKYFEEKGLPYRVRIHVEDTRVTPAIALDKVKALLGKGVRLIVGPMASGEVKEIMEFARANKIIIISPSSTAAPSILGVKEPKDKWYIFRFVTDDTFQTKAIAAEAKALKVRGVCVTYVGNAWGEGLAEYGRHEFERAGIRVEGTVRYPDPPPADFSPFIAALESCVRSLVNRGYDLREIAVVAFSYEEIATMLQQTKPESILFKVVWIGCDGNALSGAVEKACSTYEPIRKVGLYSTIFESYGPMFDKLNRTFYERYRTSPFQYALNAYDALWTIALSFVRVHERLGRYDPDEMNKTIPVVAEELSKNKMTVSGYIKLNEFNDRASGDYAIWYLTPECRWSKAGVWRYETGEVRWLAPIR